MTVTPVYRKPIAEWIPYGKSFGEFRREGLALPGTLIETTDRARLLIGDINELGGVCQDCPGIGHNEAVARYCLAWEAP